MGGMTVAPTYGGRLGVHVARTLPILWTAWVGSTLKAGLRPKTEVIIPALLYKHPLNVVSLSSSRRNHTATYAR